MNPRTRNVLVAGLCIAATFGVARYVTQKIHEFDLANTDGPPKVKVSHRPQNRPRVKPYGTLSVHLSRLRLPQLQMVSMTENRQYLFCTNENSREYDLYSGGSIRHLKAKAMASSYYLTPDGKPFESVFQSSAYGNSDIAFPYNNDAARIRLFPDGTVAVVRKIASFPGSRSENLSDPPKTQANNPGFFRSKLSQPPRLAKAPANFDPKKDYYSVLKERHGMQALPDHKEAIGVLVGIEEIFRSNHLVSVLATDIPGQVWLQEHQGFVSAGKDSLILLKDGEIRRIPLPRGYTNVHRITQSGNRVAGTFGIIDGVAPFRSFIRDGLDWKELPLPEGFDFSFVQKILDNGLIVGFVTTWEGKDIRHVVWKGNSMAILDELPAWPKRGELSVVYMASRNGTLAVKNITDAVSGATEYYLLSLAP